MPWVPTVAVGLLAALLFGLIARRLGLSPIVGYLLAGVFVGPRTPGFVGNVDLAGELADVGVILLMFGVGLGFSLRDLLSVRRIAVPGALVAAAVASLCGSLVGWMGGFQGAGALVFGLCLATSSTVVIVRGLVEFDLLKSAAGRIAVGWTIVEDLVTVTILVLLPALGGDGGRPLSEALLETAGTLVLLAVVVLYGGSLAVPRLLNFVARARSRELFTLAVLVIALGIAWMSNAVFGVSIALGAFLGGMAVGQSDLSHQAAADALPLRDAFAVLFFVAVGMLFDPLLVLNSPGLVVASLAVVLLAKPLAALSVLVLQGYPLGTSLPVAAAVSQVSEFAYVLAGLAVTHDLFPEVGRSVIVATSLISIVANPALFRAARPLERWLARSRRVVRFNLRRAGRLARLPTDEVEALSGHAVVCGHGRVGSVLAEFLRQRELSLVVIEQDRLVVEELRGRGIPALYGDAGSPTLLDRARIESARVLVVTVPDPVTVRLAVEHARSKNPEIECLVRIHGEVERRALRRFPRTQGVHGEQELAYAMARLLLQKFGVSAIEAEATVIDTRRAHGAPTRARTRIVEIHVPAHSPVVGRSLAELELPQGVLVVTIARGGEFVVPSGKTTIEPDDALLVLADIERARQIEAMVGGLAA